jgi:hypothetical protein
MKKTITLILVFTTTLLFSQVPSYVPTNGLGCYYSFVGNSNDLINSLNGVPNGGSYVNDNQGNPNSAFSFNGTTDFIDIPHDFFNGSTQNATSFRIKFKYNSQGNMTLWNKDGNWKELAITILSNKSIQFFGAYSNYYLDIKTNPNTIIENIWYDIVMVIANNTAKIYINGVEQTSYSVNNINNSTISFSSQGSCATNLGINRFGKAKSSCANAQYLNGVIDEFGIWNRALTQEEINNLYNVSLPQNACLPSYVPTNGLLGYWPFCGNANDESGNGNNGTVTGATLTTDRLNSSSSAFDFTTTGLSWTAALHQVINVPHSSSFNSNSITVSFWVNARSYFFSGIPGNDKISRLIGRVQNGYSNPNGQTWLIDLSNNQINGVILNTSTNTTQQGLSTSSNISLNEWNHLVMTFDNISLKLFLNGALVSEIAKPANFIFNTMGTSGISIGSSNQANGYWYESDAKIDDIGFWNRALTQQEINNLYNASLSTQDFAINEMSIYPNPANNVLNFKATLEVETIAIYNMLGQLVQQENINALEGSINIEKLAQGTYLVKVNDIAKGYTIIKN